MPLKTKKNKGKIVIVNLQPTKHDKNADLLINAYVDDVMKGLCDELGVEIQPFKGYFIKLQSIWTEEKKDITKEFPAVVVNESLREECEEEDNLSEDGGKEIKDRKRELHKDEVEKGEEQTDDLKRKLKNVSDNEDQSVKQIKTELPTEEISGYEIKKDEKSEENDKD